MEADHITEGIIAAAIAVHRELGPGLLESAYETCLTFELLDKGFSVQRQVEMPVVYHGHRLDCGYRMDLLVEGQVVVELKSVEGLQPLHEAQLLSYLKLSGKKVGLLLNFNVRLMKQGVRRLVLNYDEISRRPLRSLR